MQDAFFELADDLMRRIGAGEVLLAGFSGERSDFVRFNRALVRQAGSVEQRWLRLELIRGMRHASGACVLTGSAETDRARAADVLAQLRQCVDSVPEDPYLMYNAQPRNTHQVRPSALPESRAIAEAVLSAGAGTDLVGILACGEVLAGFANSLGQRNWFQTASFHIDWCLYHAGDKAVKTTFAGDRWDDTEFQRTAAAAREQLAMVALPPKNIPPGRYRAYLAPAALREIMSLLCWGGFSVKAHRTMTSSLVRMTAEQVRLAPSVTLREHGASGLVPLFYSGGYVRPPVVAIIEKGQFRQALCSPRSAKEYGLEPNGPEYPQALEMDGGDLPSSETLQALDTGVYIGNLWYLNYSDRPACRITGMTRFATFWVEHGRIVAPINVMRFDDTIYRMLGEKLARLTSECELLPDNDTYGGRSTDYMRLPGALVEEISFTL